MYQILIQIGYQMLGILVSPLFWLVVLFIVWQYRRTAKMKQNFFQLPRERIVKKIFYVLLCGLLGGFAGSLLVILLGISLEEIGLDYLWILVLLLMLIRQRFMCFAYAGGILALSSYLFGWPQINIAQLLALVAVLHMVEALLILLCGRQSALPIYTKGKDGQMIGGFFLQIFWPLPLIMLLPVLVHPMAPVLNEVFAMPDWWPVLKSFPVGQHNVIYELLPVLAALGYSDLVLTETVDNKVRHASWQLFLYSVLLLALALLGNQVPALLILPALFAPFGHEFLIRQERRREFAGPYRYRSPENGVMVLDVTAGSVAQRGGIQSGDLILFLQGEPILHRKDFLRRQLVLPDLIKMTYQRDSEIISVTLRKQITSEGLGIITAPSGSFGPYWRFDEDGGLAKILYKKFVNRLKKS